MSVTGSQVCSEAGEVCNGENAGHYCNLGTLRSNDATATRTSLKKGISVLLVFTAIIPTHLLCQV